MDKKPNRNQIAARLRSMAKIWSLLLFALAIIVIVRPRSEGVTANTPIDSLIPIALLISMIGLAVAWRKEAAGVAINIGAYLAVVPLHGLIHGEWIHFSLMIGLSPVILPGVIFGVAWLLDRK